MNKECKHLVTQNFVCTNCGAIDPNYAPPKPSEPIELDTILTRHLQEIKAGHDQKLKAELLEWMKSLVLNDVIGADEIVPSYIDFSTLMRVEGRKKLRAELRTKTRLISRRE